MAAQCCTSRIFVFEWRGYLSLTHSFSVISENINLNHILPKSGFFLGTTFLSTLNLTSTTLALLAPKLPNSMRTLNYVYYAVYAVQGHSRSPLSAPMGSSYATSCMIASCLELFPWYRGLLVKFSLSTVGCPCLTHWFGVNP